MQSIERQPDQPPISLAIAYLCKENWHLPPHLWQSKLTRRCTGIKCSSHTLPLFKITYSTITLMEELMLRKFNPFTLWLTSLLVIVAILLAACGGAATQTPAEPPSTEAPPTDPMDDPIK